MLENKNEYNYITQLWKSIFILSHQKKTYAMPETKLLKLLVTRNNAADKSSASKFFKFFFSAINYFEANTSPM